MISFTDYTYQYGRSKVTLRPFVLEPTPLNPDMLGAHIRIDVVDDENFPAEIFIWERFSTQDQDNMLVTKDRPVCVAKPADLDTYPVNNPSDRQDIPPFFRASWFEMTISSPELLVDTWNWIRSDVSGLLKSVIDLGGP